MADLLLDNDGDFDLTAFQMTVVRGVDAIAQRLLIRLRTVRGEYFLDRTRGVPYYEDVFGKENLRNRQALNAVFVDAILSTPGVAKLPEFELNISPERELSVDFKAIADDGSPIEISEVL